MWRDYIHPVSPKMNKNELPIIIYNGNNSKEIYDSAIAIVGVCDSRGSEYNAGAEDGADIVREEFYAFKSLPTHHRIADLGNICKGATQADTLSAIEQVSSALIKANIFPIFIGGSVVQAYAQAAAYLHLEKKIDMLLIDEQFELETYFDGQDINEKNYLYKLFVDHALLINSFALVGYQSYYVRDAYLKMLRDMKHDAYRLGALREDIREAEPLVRNGDMLAVNIAALKGCDAPGYIHAGPNGFFSDEMCQIMRYATASDKMTSLGIFNYNPKYDIRGITAKAIAQMIWYAIEGFGMRVGDYPVVKESDFTKFMVHMEDVEEALVFMKSKKSDRWWLRIPMSVRGKTKYQMYPCSYKDYMTAMDNEIPDVWLKALHRMR